MSTKTFNFEKSMAELEALIEKMDSDELSLEQALKHFEQGIKLTQLCQTALQKAEQKVEILLQKNGSEELIPFVDNSENE